MTIDCPMYFLCVMFTNSYNGFTVLPDYDDIEITECYPNLRVLRMNGFEAVRNDDYLLAADIVARFTLKLECLSLREGTPNRRSLNDCASLTRLTNALLDSIESIEVNYVPSKGRKEFVEAVAAKRVKVLHAFGDQGMKKCNEKGYLYSYQVPVFDFFYEKEEEDDDSDDIGPNEELENYFVGGSSG